MQKQQIDDNFFKMYGPEKKPYNQIYHYYTRVEDAILIFQSPGAPALRKICVLGAATGLVQRDFYEAFGLVSYGCEISPWAFEKIPPKFKKRTRLMDMRKYVLKCYREKIIFTLVFSNSLQYLDKKEVPEFIRRLAKICKFIHFHGSFKGDFAKDPYRKTFESYAWWNNEFINNGFEELTDMWNNKTYLWKSNKFN
jgi:hypothetical protein